MKKSRNNLKMIIKSWKNLTLGWKIRGESMEAFFLVSSQVCRHIVSVKSVHTRMSDIKIFPYLFFFNNAFLFQGILIEYYSISVPYTIKKRDSRKSKGVHGAYRSAKIRCNSIKNIVQYITIEFFLKFVQCT